MLCRMMERAWILLIDADIVTRTWCQFDVLLCNLLVCAQVDIIESRILHVLGSLLIVGGRCWCRVSLLDLYR